MTEPTIPPAAIFPDLEGRTAVVTGGSKGIGAATCRLLAQNRVRVAVVARSDDAIELVVRGIEEAGGRAIGVSADCSRLVDLERMRGEVEARLGPVDIVAAFAGGFGSYTRIQDIGEHEWHEVIDSNLTATFLALKSFLPGMIERGSGSIVTMASNSARLIDIPLTASYAAAKAGIVVLTRHVAREVGQFGIRVNCIAPATTRSERIDRIMTPKRIEEVSAMSPLGRMGMPEDSANAAVFLASQASSWITGVTLDIAGGRVML